MPGCDGLSINFNITNGVIHNCKAAPQSIAKLSQAEAVIADKGYDSETIQEQITSKGSRVVILRKRSSKKGNHDLDKGLYRYRHFGQYGTE